MEAFLWVVLGFVQMLLLAVTAVRLENYELSDYELKQRFGGQKDIYSRSRVSLHNHFREVRALRILEIVGLGVVSVVLFWHLNLPLEASLLIAGSILAIAILSRISFIQISARMLFEALMEPSVKLANLLKPLWWLVGLPPKRQIYQPSSRAEFVDQLQRIPSTVLVPKDRQKLEAILATQNKTVKDIMTPKSRVVAVDPKATLGPIVLSDLQKSGHGYFPVKTKKGEPEGILYLGDIADIQTAKQHQIAHEFMKGYVAWVDETASLEELSQAFLREKQYIILVKNQGDEFTGLVTVADLLRSMLAVVED